MRRLPAELLEAVAAGDVVPVVGDSLNLGRPAGPATPEQLVAVLRDRMGAESLGRPTYRDLPLLAAQYEAMRGPHALGRLIQEELGQSRPPVKDALLLAAKTCTEALITTSVSHSAEAALILAGHRRHTVIADPINAAYASSSHRPWLIKLAGCVSRPESVVISQDQLMWFSTAMDQVGILVRGILLTKTLVFIGYALDDPYLEMLHTLLQTSPTHSRRRYIVTDQKIPAMAAIWGRRGYELISGELTESLTELASRVNPRGRSLHLAPSDRQLFALRPFRFLDYFTEADLEVFFGRDHDSALLASMVVSSPFTLIVGPSGVGKTSLVNAGLVPKLHAEGFNTYAVRALQHPVTEILAAIGPEGAHVASDDLHDALRQTLPGKPTVVIIDQFEEFFMRVGPESREQFARQLSECLASESLDLRVVVVIREDFLHCLLELEPPIDHVFKNRYAVRPFTRSQAMQFFASTAQRFAIDIAPALVSRLLDDLDNGGIDPAQLQIVCHVLHVNSSSVLGLDAYERLGGTSGILAAYLDSTLEQLRPDLREVAKVILACMVSADRTKAMMTTTEIERDTLMTRVTVSSATLQQVIDELVKWRVIRPVPGRDRVLELAHDLLAQKIWAWIEPAEVERKYARQILHQSVMDFDRLRALPGPIQWATIERYREEISFSPEQARVALRTALHRDENVAWWMETAALAGLDIGRELVLLIESADPEAQLAALDWLMAADHASKADILDRCLESAYPAIRRTAQRLTRGHYEAAATLTDDDFVVIASGEFLFGTEDPRFEHSQPAYRVHVSSYALQRFPVTNLEYADFVRAGLARSPEHWGSENPPLRLMEHPVTQISWHEANAFCAWYGERIQRPVRLPTAAEWEKAAGWDPVAQQKHPWAWGDQYDSRKANTRTGGPGKTTAIGQYSPAGGDSPYGVVDMCGNTFDWVSDWWASTHDTTCYQDPVGPRRGQHKCARGGSWAGSAEGASAVSNKYSLAPDTRNEYVGFRMAYSLARQSERD
ncbi:SUMF1/EgtB/PvdO family nonheme iron enzyme [Nonomuraea sp. NPDC059007]|uniref:nSTAND1 domain-containing NTPase n=1 Tax=Nonomuraea sp. NPDC059007 TaxID=3346692 RepID=UPI0036C6FEBA